MISPLLLVIGSLLSVDIAGDVAPKETAPVLVVSVPERANQTILEVIQRLRGEATSVGFEVRLAEPSAPVPRAELEAWSRARPVAVVTIDAAERPSLLTLTFTVQASGRRKEERLTMDGVTQDRADVVVAVRAVDFVRTCLMDTIASAQIGNAPPSRDAEAPPKGEPPARMYLAAGAVVLGSFSSFSPSIVPELQAAFRPSVWARIGVVAFGFGTDSTAESRAGQVSVDQRFVGLGLTLLGRPWRRMHAFADVHAGEFWAKAVGQARAPNLGRSLTLSSVAALVAVGVAVDLGGPVSLELGGGTLWLRNSAKIYSAEDEYVGSVGRPSWYGSAKMGLTF